MRDNLETKLPQVIYPHRDGLCLADAQGQRVNIQTNAAPPCKQGFDYGGARPHHGIKHNVAGSGEATNENTGQLRRKLGGECVDLMRGIAAVYTMKIELTCQKST